MHLDAEPTRDPVDLCVISIEAGIFLCAAYMLTRRLWFPIGIHAGWNFTQEGVWGVSVSGTTPHGLIQATLSGPVWISGGAFGAEASVIAIVICGTMGLLLLRQVARRGGLVAPYWRRRRHDVLRAAGGTDGAA